nr:hypothetical protein [Candidatus Sigynarchaeota archaeon]
MPLRFKSEPLDVKEIVTKRLGQMGQKGFRIPRLAKTIAEEGEQILVPVHGMPVFQIGLNDLAKGGTIDVAKQTGWRYLLEHKNSVIASTETVLGPEQKHHFAAVTEGPLVQGTVSAIKAADSLKEISTGEYEVRLLLVPALYAMALWLVNLQKGSDLAIPISPAPPYMTPNKIISLNDLLSLLQKEAKALVENQLGIEPVGG